MYNVKEGEAASCGQVCILSPPGGGMMADEVLFFKNYNQLCGPHLPTWETIQKQLLLGQLLSLPPPIV